MKIIYGGDSCVFQGASQLNDVVIKYRGNPYLSHNHLEIVELLSENQAQVNNIQSQSLLLHGNNQIHIGYLNPVDGDLKLFRYTGYFKILTAKSGGENLTIETQSIDFCQLINSKFDNMGKPEQYIGTYRNGIGMKKSPKIKIAKPISRKLKSAVKKPTAIRRTGGY